MKKVKLKIIIPALIMIAVTVFAVWYFSFSDRKSPSDIVSIKISSEAPLFSRYNKYFIDFNSNTVTKTERDGDDEKEKTTHFSDVDKENFVNKANMYGFFSWKESYLGKRPNDNYLIGICITYSDGSEQDICFQSPNIPPSYETMQDVFLETFGCLI
ncbi:MAG: hypothetical protein NC177_04035 [Ruminococcus flavefaciens]|nr:hypothetical protein [Ruminococcus flavefaciens]